MPRHWKEQSRGRNESTDTAFQFVGNLRHGRRLHEVEVPEQADPHDAEQHVQPAEHRQPFAVEVLEAAESDAYFARRPRGHRLSAWASDQSRLLPERLALEKRIATIGLRFGFGPVPRPPHWSGYRVAPRSIEFWRDRPFRLHERLLFKDAPGGWTTERLYP